jgi:carbonyl reductase 1
VVPTSRDPRQGFVTLDVTRAYQVGALAQQLAAEGGVDVLVNNAGASPDGFDESVVRRTLEANFLGAMRVTDALLPSMRPGGRVVMVSSGLGSLTGVRGELRARFEDPRLTRDGLLALVEEFPRDVAAGVHERRGWPSNAYRVSKIAMNALVRVMARELEGDPRRILVNAADPGWVRTRMGGRSAPRSVEHGARTPVWLALLPDGGPTGGFFRDENAVAF